MNHMPRASVIFDFDSTLVGVESLDELLWMSLVKRKLPASKLRALEREICAITDAGMEGEVDFPTSIARRLRVARPSRSDLATLALRMTEAITSGIPAIIRHIHEAGARAFIVSGGLLDLILPVAGALEIPTERVFGNTPVFDDTGTLTGIRSGPLATTQGKTTILRDLRTAGILGETVIMVGDGISDIHPYEAGIADHFIGVGIHRSRNSVLDRSPHFARSSQELALCLSPLLTP